jgi:hypothetical protein
MREKVYFGLVRKEFVEVLQSSILCNYLGVPHVQKVGGFFFPFKFYQLFLQIHCFPFISFCSSLLSYYFFVLWRDKRGTCFVQIESVFWMEIYEFYFFSLRSIPNKSLWPISMLGMCECVKNEFFFGFA